MIRMAFTSRGTGIIEMEKTKTRKIIVKWTTLDMDAETSLSGKVLKLGRGLKDVFNAGNELPFSLAEIKEEYRRLIRAGSESILFFLFFLFFLVGAGNRECRRSIADVSEMEIIQMERT